MQTDLPPHIPSLLVSLPMANLGVIVQGPFGWWPGIALEGQDGRVVVNTKGPSGWMVDPSRLPFERVFVDLSVRSSQVALVQALFVGELCWRCHGEGTPCRRCERAAEKKGEPVSGAVCLGCDGTRWDRPPADVAWMLERPLGEVEHERAGWVGMLLASTARRMANGLPPIRAVIDLSEREQIPDCVSVRGYGDLAYAYCGEEGWVIVSSGEDVARGKETGEAGWAALAEAALQHDYAVFDGTLRLPPEMRA